MQLAYLHGFASGPGSTKALFFRARLEELGLSLEIPELAPDFTRMTVSGELAVVEEILARERAVLLGSSLGGYLAALAAARQPERVAGLVLFAPAFGFLQRWETRLGAEAMARWRAEGALPVFHYGTQREEPLSIGLVDDARRYPPEPDPSCRALIFAGRHDESVPLTAVERFARAGENRELIAFDAGHELTDVLDPMWRATRRFLAGIGAAPKLRETREPKRPT